MDEFDNKIRTRPEAIIQRALTNYLKIRDWYVKSTHGNAYQSGFPDMYCHHRKYGARWIECKVAGHYAFTKAQLENFPIMTGFGVQIYILTAATDHEYAKLWAPGNWHQYLPVNKAPRTRILAPKTHGYVPKYPTPGIKPDEKKK